MELWTGSARKQFGGSISDPHCRGLGGQDSSVISTPASGLERSVDFLAIPRFRSAACCGSHLKQSSERGWFLGLGVVMGKCHDKTCIMSFFILPWVLWIGMGTEWKLLHPSSLSIGMLTNGSEVLITTGRTLTTLWQSNMAMENPSFFCGMWAFPLL